MPMTRRYIHVHLDFKTNEIEKALQNNIDIVEKWYKMNNMKINPIVLNEC